MTILFMTLTAPPLIYNYLPFLLWGKPPLLAKHHMQKDIYLPEMKKPLKSLLTPFIAGGEGVMFLLLQA